MRKSIAQKDAESIQLQEYLGGKKSGDKLSYLQIEHDTGIKMDVRGKAHLRRCLHRMKLEYTCHIGYGVELASTDTAVPILSTKLVRIDRAVRRGDRSQRNIQEQFFHSLNPEQQKQILFAGAVFGAIRLAADQGRRLYKANKTESVSIQLPKLA